MRAGRRPRGSNTKSRHRRSGQDASQACRRAVLHKPHPICDPKGVPGVPDPSRPLTVLATSRTVAISPHRNTAYERLVSDHPEGRVFTHFAANPTAALAAPSQQAQEAFSPGNPTVRARPEVVMDVPGSGLRRHAGRPFQPLGCPRCASPGGRSVVLGNVEPHPVGCRTGASRRTGPRSSEAGQRREPRPRTAAPAGRVNIRT